MLRKKDLYNVAIVGATGAVGGEFLKVLCQRKFPIATLKLLASPQSAGKKLDFGGKQHRVEALTENSFHDVDIALFSAGGARSKLFAPIAVNSACVVVDNSSAFRMDAKVPLVVPEINPQDAFKHDGIIANPNCTTIIMGVAVYPIHNINPIRRIVVASYQAVSGAGAKALAEFHTQLKDIAAGRPPRAEVFPHIIANNLFSHNSRIEANGYNEEENKLIRETQKIFGDPSIMITPTCVRVPIERAHAEAITLELAHPVDLEKIRQALNTAPGIKVVDDPARNLFPMPSTATGQDEVLVGRLRRDGFRADSVSLFVCGDQLLKGAALNAVQIAELLIR